MGILDSFYFKENIAGVEHDYRITNTGEKFEVEKDGVVIAEVRFYEAWEQLSGDKLPGNLFDAITDRIDDHYL